MRYVSATDHALLMAGAIAVKMGFVPENRHKASTMSTYVDWVADELGVYVMIVYGASPPPPGVSGG